MGNKFDDLKEFSEFLRGLKGQFLKALSEGLEQSSTRLENAVREELDGRVSEAESAALTGGAGNGASAKVWTEIRESMGHHIEELSAEVGSTAEKATGLEWGVYAQSPYPFLAPVAVKNVDMIKDVIGASAYAGLTGGEAKGDPE